MQVFTKFLQVILQEFLQVRSEEVEMEILDFQNEIILKTIISDEKF